MSTIITVAQRKGGVGKTTLAVCITAELARRGHGISLVDADPQRSASLWAEPGQLEFPVHEIGLGLDTISVWTRDVLSVQSELLVIDTAPNEREMGASIALANLILIPCTASGLDLEATAATLAIIAAVRARRRLPAQVILVPNRLDARTLEGRQLVQELQTFGEMVAPAISARSAFVRSFAMGQSVASFAPDEPADFEIRALADTVEDALARP
ncbi:ParA family protein [Bradyrhizobium sp. WSM471]|uniref:ParA family protein n=1 Tax=Bradyrhizobium sp. WSM471 TaxID=319017 RepID=UPI00024D21B3|nr:MULTISPECIES: ParA family protein [Bradyrhizobium]EHR01322.1 ATPase involved in chromosome partitioning [Bradyrhizobium sp. WSM471]UFW43382.1 ParA family protein [Bradyrhizobium canariense]